MAFYIRSTDPDRPHYGYSYWTEEGVPTGTDLFLRKTYSTESEAQAVIDTTGNWVHFLKTTGLTFSVVEE
tara:strand:+ start:371 stop:580 length:210 start_codon:yes stop_codon:yes gene_type:complete